MILLSTVWHTGTNYMLRELKGPHIVQKHCRRSLDTREFDRVVTTYRDPREVARSWAQRYTLKEVEKDWREQWEVWRKLIDEGAEVARVDEFTGEPVKQTPRGRIYREMTQAMDDREAFGKHFPLELLDYAEALVPEGMK